MEQASFRMTFNGNLIANTISNNGNDTLDISSSTSINFSSPQIQLGNAVQFNTNTNTISTSTDLKIQSTTKITLDAPQIIIGDFTKPLQTVYIYGQVYQPNTTMLQFFDGYMIQQGI